MGTFVFKWAHPDASEVYVTGTFDGWKKTEKLDKVGDHFEKQVTLSDASQKIYYKFVVDGNWVLDHTAPKEADESGNENNVLTPERIVKEAPPTAAIMSSVTPNSTTAALAGSVPLEKNEKPDGLPGTFPETPAFDQNKEFGVNPLPAAPGAINPIQLAPGEKIPEYLAGGDTTSQVKLDRDAYEKSDALPGGVATFSSAAPGSTTAALAAGAPIETTVPAIVKESQEKANFGPEASAVPEEVKEKAAVENELLEKVKEAPSTAEGTAGKGTEKTEGTVTPGEAGASILAAATAAGAAVYAGATNLASTAQANATSAASNLPDSVKGSLPASVQNAIGTTAKEEKIEETSPSVPAEVKASIAEAGKGPEAAGNTEAVEEKKAVEAELLKEVKPVDAIGEQSKTEAPQPDTTKADKTLETAAIAPLSTTEPAVGANGSQTTAGPSTPAKDTSKSPATAEKKKKNRISAFFGKLKSKKSDN